MDSALSATVLQYVILKVNGKYYQQKTNSEKTNSEKALFVLFLWFAPEMCLKWHEEEKRVQQAKKKCPK